VESLILHSYPNKGIWLANASPKPTPWDAPVDSLLQEPPAIETQKAQSLNQKQGAQSIHCEKNRILIS
jgi:hypothetical protein